ncbi:uncharacterized protein METZ01_LOCUS227816 [marine metagenome]|uniref:Uncharacterized protein n=1 Tax=marine metagenome TaxID=408172 RepID=A0A382GJ99_9ZZZZ
MANLKHIGRFKETGRKVAVVFRTLPNEPDNCLVVRTEGLPDSDHDLLIRLIESNTGQVAHELADAMQRTPLNDGSIMLARFHARGNLVKAGTSEIEMTPDTQTTISLDELNKTIADQKGVQVKDLAVGGTQVEEVGSVNEVPIPTVAAESQTAKVDEPLTDDALATKLRADADGLFKEATDLRKQAEDLSPTKKGTARVKE